ncbi:MAG: hypothetical protein KJ630_03135 [Proteobacteria bacterium]|nr:hypothetical protein [Pseudomonadota bacterium]
MKILGIISSCVGGDWPPLLALASGLARRGHEVRMVCDPGTEPAVQAADLMALCLPEHQSLGRRFNPMLQQIMAGRQELAKDSTNPLAEWGQATLPRVRTALVQWQPSLIIGSLFCQHLAQMVAAAYRGKWCCVNPSFFFGDGNRLPEKSDFSSIGALMYKHWLLPPLCRAGLVLHATDALFDGVRSTAANHLHTGPLLWEIPGDVPSFLAAPGPPWILLSLSTAPQEGDLEIVHRTAEALRNAPYRVLTTLGAPDRLCQLMNLPDNMYVSDYLPHSAVLPFCRMIISHAGHGLVLKGMFHGVPMVLIPWGRDQPGVAARALASGVARVIVRQELSAQALADAIKSIQVDTWIAESVRRESLRLRSGNSLSLALDRLEAFGGV